MPFVPVENVVEVEMRMLLDSQQVENTLYFHKDTDWDLPSLTALNNAMTAWWVDSYGPLTSTATRLNEVACTDLTTATSTQLTLPAPAGTFGGQSTEQMSNNVSLAISFRTLNRGRSFRGRNYFVGLTIDQVLANTVAPGTLSGLQSAYEALFDVATAASCVWVVVSRFSGVDPTTKQPIPRTAGIATPVSSVVIVDAVVDSQRRRLPKRGK